MSVWGNTHTFFKNLNYEIYIKNKNNDREILCIKSAKVDGKKILANTLYELINGKFVKA